MIEDILNKFWKKYSFILSSIFATGLVLASFYFGLASGIGSSFFILLDATFFSSELFRLGLVISFSAIVLRVFHMFRGGIRASLAPAKGNTDPQSNLAPSFALWVANFMLAAFFLIVAVVVINTFFLDVLHQAWFVCQLLVALLTSVLILFLSEWRKKSLRAAVRGTVQIVTSCVTKPLLSVSTSKIYSGWLIVLILSFSFYTGVLRVSTLASGEPLEIRMAEDISLQGPLLGSTRNGVLLLEIKDKVGGQVRFGGLNFLAPAQYDGALHLIAYSNIIEIKTIGYDRLPRFWTMDFFDQPF